MAMRAQPPLDMYPGCRVYAKVPLPTGTTGDGGPSWVLGMVVEIDEDQVTFAYNTPRGAEGSLVVGGLRFDLARGLKKHLRTEAPATKQRISGSFPSKSKELIRAYCGLAMELGEESFLSVTEEDPSVEEELRERVRELEQALSRKGPTRSPSQPGAGACEGEHESEEEDDEDEDEPGDLEGLISFARRAEARANPARLAAARPAPAASSAAPPRGLKSLSTSGRAPSRKADAGVLETLTEQLLTARGPSSSTGGGDNLNLLIQLEMLKQLRKNKRPGDEDSDDDQLWSGTGGSGGGKGAGVGKTLSRYHALRRRVRKDPETVIRRYVEKMRLQVGAEPGQPWTLMDVNRRLAWGRFKSLQRCHYILAQCFQRLDEGSYLEAQALLVQGLKATHQAAIDNGSWDNAWLLTTLPDPLRRERFGGEEEELEIIAQYQRAVKDLEDRVRKGGGGADHEEDAPAPKGKGKNKAKGKAED